jgi:hypothetical protein
MIHILPNSWWQTTQHDDKTCFQVLIIHSQAINQTNFLHDNIKKNYTLLSTKKKNIMVCCHHGDFVLEILILERYLGTLMNMVLCGSRDIWGL